VPPLVLHRKNPPVRKHRNKIRVRLLVRDLGPEGKLHPFNEPDPDSNLVVPVDVEHAADLLPLCSRSLARWM
jgi:hypothetical protein